VAAHATQHADSGAEKTIEGLIHYVWAVESHHWTCDRCHSLKDVVGDDGVVVPSHPKLKELRKKRKQVLRRKVAEEGARVGGIRSENEMLLRILNDGDTLERA
jgi:hypothetical protein